MYEGVGEEDEGAEGKRERAQAEQVDEAVSVGAKWATPSVKADYIILSSEITLCMYKYIYVYISWDTIAKPPTAYTLMGEFNCEILQLLSPAPSPTS